MHKKCECKKSLFFIPAALIVGYWELVIVFDAAIFYFSGVVFMSQLYNCLEKFTLVSNAWNPCKKRMSLSPDPRPLKNTNIVCLISVFRLL